MIHTLTAREGALLCMCAILFVLIAVVLALSGCSNPTDPFARFDDDAILINGPGYAPGTFPDAITWEYVINSEHKLWFLHDEGIVWTHVADTARLRVEYPPIQSRGNEIWVHFEDFYFWGVRDGSSAIKGWSIYRGTKTRTTLKPRVL